LSGQREVKVRETFRNMKKKPRDIKRRGGVVRDEKRESVCRGGRAGPRGREDRNGKKKKKFQRGRMESLTRASAN